MIWIVIYVLTVILSIQLHFMVGYLIKKRFRVLGKSHELSDFQMKFKKDEGVLKRWSKYIVFFIPILNLCIVSIEISHKDKNIRLLIKETEKMKSHVHDENEEIQSCENEIYNEELNISHYSPHGEENLDFSEDYQLYLEARAAEENKGGMTL